MFGMTKGPLGQSEASCFGMNRHSRVEVAQVPLEASPEPEQTLNIKEGFFGSFSLSLLNLLLSCLQFIFLIFIPLISHDLPPRKQVNSFLGT